MTAIMPTSYSRKALYAPSPATTRGQAVHLGGDPKGINFLYTNGRSVIIRNLANPEIAKEYTGHSHQTTVARYAPSGYYIASADVQGNVRIWDTTQAENILKIETKVFSGRVNDLDWDFESKRIIAVGEGKSRQVNVYISIRPGRPLRAVTGSDDMTVNFYHGVPFKFNKSITNHSRFVQSVRYSPNGDLFASSGSDGKIFLYDGKTGDDVAEISASENAHTGGIFSVSWSPDSTQLMTASADQTVKVWDVAAKAVVSTFKFSDVQHIDHQQVGSLWQGQYQISLSLSGDINYLDARSGNTPVRVVRKEGANVVSGTGHTNQITALVADKNRVVSAGMDDSIRTIISSTKAFEPHVVASGGIPKGLAVLGGLQVFVTHKDELVTSVNGSNETRVKLSYSPSAVAIAPNGSIAAIGSEEGDVYLYKVEGAVLSVTGKLESNKGTITAISYSPKGDLVAVADTQRNVIVYDTATNTMKINQWVFHTARVNCVSWSPSGLHAVSGSLDTNVEVWSVEKPMKHISIKCAHQDSVTGAIFIDENTIASCDQSHLSIRSLSPPHMSKRAKPLLLEEKRRRMLSIFHETKSFFNLKEIEKIAPKSKGIIEKSVKEVVDGLVADNLIQMEKIGASNYYWSFPDANAHQARMRLEAVSEELVAIKEKERQIQLEMSDAMSARQETHERRLVIAELEAASLLEAKLTLEVDRYKDSDPEVLRAKELGANIAFEAANRWTDNIFALQRYCRNSFGVNNADFCSQFFIPDDLDNVS
ncbi:hypothetical protein BSLG_000847 [Batrachochytrium salamandrivorans]|nr:hypothetical protein BSLG_000847 [Batrachochytrium salamandrivorans]